MVINMSEQQLIEKLELQNYTKSKEIEILRINIINLNKEKARLEEELKIEKNRTLFDIIFRRNRSKKWKK